MTVVARLCLGWEYVTCNISLETAAYRNTGDVRDCTDQQCLDQELQPFNLMSF